MNYPAVCPCLVVFVGYSIFVDVVCYLLSGLMLFDWKIGKTFNLEYLTAPRWSAPIFHIVLRSGKEKKKHVAL